MTDHPKFFNSNHFSTEKFPEVIAFCDRDPNTHIHNSSEESYEYTFKGQTRYTLKKYTTQWELIEIADKQAVRVSTGRSLGMVLLQALRFSNADKDKQEELVNILFPVAATDVEKALAFMYYYGGYPANYLDITSELALIVEHFIGPDLTFLAYSYIPVDYLEWIREQLKNAGLLQTGTNKTLLVYKK